MSHFDELPGRSRNHAIEAEAIAAFQTRLAESGVFILQAQDRTDYGTDCQIEVTVAGQATNARVHVQLKGTEKALNADGSLSVDVRRTNLNYLLMQPYSIYVAYHLPTRSLRIRTAESVLRQYQHHGANWTDQTSLTVTFVDELTVDRLQRLAGLAGSDAKVARDRRIDQVGTPSPAGTAHVLRSPPDIHVPDDPVVARQLLQQLYDQNADEAISAGFAKFASLFGLDSDEIGMCYMAEINLGMDGLSHHRARIDEAITFSQKRLTHRRYQTGSLQYTIGNAFHALREEDAAKYAYLAALADEEVASSADLASQVHKNLGSSYAILGEQDQAVKHYEKALQFDPELAEAHHCLGIHYVRLGRYDDALRHLDQVLFSDQKQGRISSVAGWRANVLFNLGDGRAAFRELNSLIAQADRLAWVRPWCCRPVAAFGRANIDNARQATSFWQRYVKADPNDAAARWELLMAMFYLRGKGENVGKTYNEFREEFDTHITHIDPKNAALPWDRLGHWAQDSDDWVEAERCFRKAYELAGGEYGFCLAIALKYQGQFEESVPLLLEQAETIQPDAISWFHLAAAYHSLDRWPEAISAYQSALTLDPKHAVAMFDLGGAHYNSGDFPMAADVWTAAIERFPDHELAARLRKDLPSLFGRPEG